MRWHNVAGVLLAFLWSMNARCDRVTQVATPEIVDRVAVPIAECECECEIGNGCKCDVCKCDPRPVVIAEQPKPAEQSKPKPAVAIIEPMTGIVVSGAAVVMISAPWCEPCQQFKRGTMPASLKARGWEFAVDESQRTGAKVYPTFRIYDGKRWHTTTGNLTGAKLQSILALPPKSRFVPIRERVQATPQSWILDGEPWTRQSLIDHLADHPNHGHSRQQLEAMTMDQLDRLHTSDHEGRSIVMMPAYRYRLFSRR